MAAKLKVFVTSDGLTDYVVAASSKPKALAAWGAHQDLFKTGGARETEDPELTKDALAAPGEVLRRPAGAHASFARQPKPPKREKPKGPSKVALKKVAGLEQKLAALASSHDSEVAAIEDARAALDARETKVRENFQVQRAKLSVALREARAALG